MKVFVRESVTWISVGKILSACASLWIYSICVSSFKPNKYIVMTPFCQSFNNSAREADSGPTQVCSSESRFIYVWIGYLCVRGLFVVFALDVCLGGDLASVEPFQVSGEEKRWTDRSGGSWGSILVILKGRSTSCQNQYRVAQYTLWYITGQWDRSAVYKEMSLLTDTCGNFSIWFGFWHNPQPLL